MAARELHDESLEAAEIAEALIAENETLRAGYGAARLEIASLHAQLEAVRAGGVGASPAHDDSLTVAYLAGSHDAKRAALASQAQPVASESLVKWASLIELAQTDWHTGYEAARAYVKVQLECATPQPAAPAQAGEYPPLVCDYCGALTPDPWHSSGTMNGKMSKHIHSCDSCVVEAEVQKQDEALIRLMLEALECSGEPDNPGHRCSHCDDYVDRNSRLRNAARAWLEGKP